MGYKATIETGENFFDSPEGPDPNGSYWSLTEFGYEQYKEASEYLGKKVLPFGKNTSKKTMKEFTIKISMDDPNGTAEEDLNRQLDGLYDLGYETVNVEII